MPKGILENAREAIEGKNLKLIAFDKKICMSLLKRQFSITVLSPIMDALE